MSKRPLLACRTRCICSMETLHYVSDKVLSVFHACIVIPLFVLCIFEENNSETSQFTKETILHCKVFPRKAYGILTLFIAIGSCLACIGKTIKKKYIMKNTLTSTENRWIGINREGVETHNLTVLARHGGRDIRTFATTSNVNISTGLGNMRLYLVSYIKHYFLELFCIMLWKTMEITTWNYVRVWHIILFWCWVSSITIVLRRCCLFSSIRLLEILLQSVLHVESQRYRTFKVPAVCKWDLYSKI